MKCSYDLKGEDSYNDNVYSEYETRDYFVDGSEVRIEPETRERGEKCKKFTGDLLLANEEQDLYKKNIIVDDQEASKKRYTRLAKIMRTGTEEEKKSAGEEACLYMKGFVRNYIYSSYRTYIERDPSYAEDLEQVAYLYIIKNLYRYKPELGQPSTFLRPYIKSAMSSETNRMKHSLSPADATLKRKISKLQIKYKEAGLKLTIADIVIETHETKSKVADILQMMGRDMNTHLEAIMDFEQLVAGDSQINCVFETPENLVMRKMTIEFIMEFMNTHFTQMEVEIFLRIKIDQEPIPQLAESLGIQEDKIRRTLEKIQHSVKYDSNIRKLCSGYVKESAEDSSFLVLPLQGENENMNLLEKFVL